MNFEARTRPGVLPAKCAILVRMFRRERLAAALVAVACGYAAMWLVHVVAVVVGDPGSGWVGACELIAFGFALGMGYKQASNRFSRPRRHPDEPPQVTGDEYRPESPGRN